MRQQAVPASHRSHTRLHWQQCGGPGRECISVSQGPNTTPELSTSSERVNEKPVSYTTRRLTLDLAQFASTCGLELFQCGPSWGGKCGYRTERDRRSERWRTESGDANRCDHHTDCDWLYSQCNRFIRRRTTLRRRQRPGRDIQLCVYRGKNSAPGA